MLLTGNPFSGTPAHCLKKTTHLPENKTLSCFSCISRLKSNQTCAFLTVVKFVVHSSLASCPGSSPKECSLWKIPSPDTPGTLPQENHTLLPRIAWHSSENKTLSCTSRLKSNQTCACFAVTKLVVRSSLASCPNPSSKECSLWKTPSPDTLGTLPQVSHTSLP